MAHVNIYVCVFQIHIYTHTHIDTDTENTNITFIDSHNILIFFPIPLSHFDELDNLDEIRAKPLRCLHWDNLG